MLVGFFGCCGAVRESQCLLGSVSTNTYKFKSIKGTSAFVPKISPQKWQLLENKINRITFLLFRHTDSELGFGFFQFFACLLIIFGAEVAAGVFGFLNKDKVDLLYYSFNIAQESNKSQWHNMICFPSITQIIQDVQNFYTTTYNESKNGTLITSYQKIVSK